MTRRELFNILRFSAEEVYPSEEARSVAQIIGNEIFNTGWRELIDNPEVEVNTQNIEAILADIKAARPVQYIIGATDWGGFRLSVREGVLIPRPETEELVRWVMEVYSPDYQGDILDIGTGSGAIAIALSNYFGSAKITGFDISKEALKIAKENAAGLDIEFQHIDILTVNSNREWDLVISNPPYIPREEISKMERNVVDFEPESALFVKEPLQFYIAIVKNITLRPGGRIFFECHEKYAEDVAQLLESEGFTDVELRSDINHKPRMVCGRIR